MKALVYLGPRKMELQDVPERVPAPGEARVRVAAAPEQVEALAEPLEDLLRRQDPRPRRGQLERERHVVETAAELFDGRAGGQPRPRAEEGHGVRLCKWQHLVLGLAADPEQLT